MTDEKLTSFQRLYVTVEKAIHEIDAYFTSGGTDEQLVEQTIAHWYPNASDQGSWM